MTKSSTEYVIKDYEAMSYDELAAVKEDIEQQLRDLRQLHKLVAAVQDTKEVQKLAAEKLLKMDKGEIEALKHFISAGKVESGGQVHDI